VRIAAAKLQGYLQATVQIALKIFARDRANSNCLSVMAGLIVGILFVLFSVYNAAYWAENE